MYVHVVPVGIGLNTMNLQVETAEMHVSPMWVAQEFRQQVPAGVWVEALSPARIDLAGGWTDTPPICYEQGGAVLNIAIKVKGYDLYF